MLKGVAGNQAGFITVSATYSIGVIQALSSDAHCDSQNNDDEDDDNNFIVACRCI